MDSHSGRNFKKGDVVQYIDYGRTETVIITGIGYNDEDVLCYFTSQGSRNGPKIDETGEWIGVAKNSS